MKRLISLFWGDVTLKPFCFEPIALAEPLKKGIDYRTP
jgi:hypothetical protein